MIKLASTLIALASLVPSASPKLLPSAKPAPQNGGTAIVKVMPAQLTAEENTQITTTNENNTQRSLVNDTSATNPDAPLPQTRPARPTRKPNDVQDKRNTADIAQGTDNVRIIDNMNNTGNTNNNLGTNNNNNNSGTNNNLTNRNTQTLDNNNNSGINNNLSTNLQTTNDTLTFDNTVSTADDNYNQYKAVLDQRFAYMFELKQQLDAASQNTQLKWDEYYMLRQSYEKQLKKLIAQWVMDQQYAAM